MMSSVIFIEKDSNGWRTLAKFVHENVSDSNQGILKGKYHCTIDLLFNWFGISCMTTDHFCFYLQNRLIQTSQTGGQQYSDTSTFSIPCSNRRQSLLYLPWPLEMILSLSCRPRWPKQVQ